MPPRVEDVYKIIINDKRKLLKIKSDLQLSNTECEHLEKIYKNISEKFNIATERNSRIKTLYETKAKELDDKMMHLYKIHEKFYPQDQA